MDNDRVKVLKKLPFMNLNKLLGTNTPVVFPGKIQRIHFLFLRKYKEYYPEYQRLSFQINLWRLSVEISSRMCQSNSYKKTQRLRANFTILMSSRLYEYTCWLLMNSLEASKCNWNEFRSKNSFTRFPSVLVITKLSIIIMLRQYGIEIIEMLSCYDSLSLILLWTFVKACGIVCCYIFNHGYYNVDFELLFSLMRDE